MLVGPGQRPYVPQAPQESEGLAGIYAYLRELDSAINANHAAIINNAIGLSGVRGLASTGTTAQNFIQELSIGNVCSISWVFTNLEYDATYFLWYTLIPTTGVSGPLAVNTIRRAPTGVDFVFNGKAPSGMLLDVVMLR